MGWVELRGGRGCNHKLCLILYTPIHLYTLHTLYYTPIELTLYQFFATPSKFHTMWCGSYRGVEVERFHCRIFIFIEFS